MTSRIFRLAAIAVTAGALMAGSVVQAHPKLVASVPVANAATDGKGDIKLTFSEALVAQFSGMSVMMTDMPGMKMSAPMAVGAVTTTVAADGKTLVGHLKSPLTTGTYSLAWHAVTADTHRVEGSYSFTVK